MRGLDEWLPPTIHVAGTETGLSIAQVLFPENLVSRSNILCAVMSDESWNRSAPYAVDKTRTELFERVVLPHLDAAYNLARWLTRNQHDADDVVQESYLRALRSFNSFQHGRDARPWLLKIVRNTCYTWLRANRAHELITGDDDLSQEPATDAGPEMAFIKKVDSQILRQALEDLKLEYREAVVLRELEGLAYKEISELLDVPLGTVMSRLARGRKELCRILQLRGQGLKR